MRHLRAITTTALCALPALAAAQDATLLDTITISANLENTDLARTGATVTVLGEEQIARAGDTRVIDYLSRLPGIQISGSGPIGTTARLYLRGAPAQYVSVLVDGIDVSDGADTQGAFDFGTLSTQDISRIEILEGANSALYGANAVAGVVNITTKRATKDGIEQNVAAEYGRYATRKFSYSIAGRSERAEGALTYAHITTHGFSAKDARDGNFEADGYRANRLSGYGEYHFDTGLTLGISGFAEKSRGEFDDWTGDTPASAGNDYTTRDARGARVYAEFDTGALSNSLSATYFRTERDSCQDGDCAPFNADRVKLGYQGGLDVGPSGRFVFGADTTRDEDDNHHSARISGVFSQLNYTVTPDFDASLSLRHDRHSDFGHYTSARLAGVYRLQPDLMLRASFGNGFRAPSLYELFSDYGDAALKRETSQSADIGIEKLWGEQASLRATLFYLDADNLIGWDYAATACGQSYGCYNQVDGHSRRSGLELAGHLRATETLDLTAAYTYTDSATNAGTGWARVARHDLTLGADAAITERIGGSLSLHYLGDRQNDLSDFAVVNASASYDLGEDRSVYLRVENLFDTQYQMNKGYGTSDRAFYVGLRAAF